jgi:hypothetical protein
LIWTTRLLVWWKNPGFQAPDTYLISACLATSA